MLQAIIAGIITLVVLAVAFVIFFRVRNNSGHGAQTHAKSNVKTISTFGVGSGGHASILSSGVPQVAGHRSASGMSADSLQSRFVAMGVLAAAVFGSLGVKLWSLQILEGSSYSEQAKENLYTTVTTPAPRGVIYDVDGIALVNNKTSLTILADSDVADNRDVVRRLSVLLGLPYGVVRQRIEDTSNGAQSQRIVASDAKMRDVAFIVEHAEAFPGVTTQTRTVRNYPYGALAAHVLGYTGTISEEQLSKTIEGRTLASGDTVGQSGVEQQYDNVLVGDHGIRTLVVDSSGTIQQVVSETSPTKGNDLYLTICARVQEVADKGLRSLIAPSGKIGSGTGRAGSIVCLDCINGEVIALANYPTYKPGNFVGGISQDVWDQFNTSSSYYPLMNRAIAGTYPMASTFKSFSGMAGLEYNFADDKKTWTCTGTWTGFGEAYAQKCWLTSGHGTIDFKTAIIDSCDTVFYEIAKDFYDARGTIGIDAMQNYIMKFGFESETGIDLSGEAVGRIPTPEWKAEYLKDAPEEAQWLPGDMSNMVIGQGYVLGTPMQLAVAYGAIATGNIVKPHVMKEVRNSVGETVVTNQASGVVTDLGLNQKNLALVRSGLRGVVTDEAEVASAFSDVSEPAAGKTGTAEFTDKNDHALFACYAPYDNPKYVVACIIEEGVAGATAASPIAAAVLEAALQHKAGTLTESMDVVPATYGTETGISSSKTASRSD